MEEQPVRAALRELLVAFPVYRTYGTVDGLPPEGVAMLHKVVNKVKASEHAPDPGALDFIARIFKGEVAATAADSAATFRTRFQQLTGPLMAKSVEDTLFFRQHMELALNEVGAEPLPRTFSVKRFHDEMTTRLAHQPDALSGTSTHDTKRGEDARARLYTLTEAPELWAECVARWRQMNQTKVVFLNDGTAPKGVDTWMLYQALAGVWPTTLQPDDEAGLNALEERFLPFVEKALREAKLRTDWVDTNDAYENAVLEYARHLLSPANQDFLQDFTRSLQPFVHAGLVNSLTQTMVKLTAPGVPDIYQGSEGLNFSLVDPDNRREPDFQALTRWLDDDEKGAPVTEEAWLSGQFKQHVIAKALHLRLQNPALFRRGDYLPLSATGARAENVIAFARTQGDEAVIVIAPRLVLGVLEGSLAAPHAELWVDTEIALPAALANRRYRDILSGKEVAVTDRIDVQTFNGYSSAILITR